MLVTVNTDSVDLVHNTEVLEAALSELPAGWIVDLEFFKAGTFSFVKTSDDWFAAADESFIWEDTFDFISTIRGNNHLEEEAWQVTFQEPLIGDVAKQQNEALQKCLDAVNGETLLDGRFIKYTNFFLDTENDLKPIGLLAVANNIFLKEYQDDHNFMKLFTKKGDEK